MGGRWRRGDGVGGWPHPPAFLFALFLLLVIAVAVVEVRLVSAAFTLVGLSPLMAGLVLLASLLGSAVNIPVASIAGEADHVEYQRVRWLGVTYLVPRGTPRRITIAVNVGGAVIPVAMSVYLAVRARIWPDVLVATVLVAALVRLVSRPVRGVGIAVPAVLPALAAALVAGALHPVGGAGALAYIAGSLGTLIGADLTRLNAVRGLGAPQVSIGGAGTFDGVFISGVLAVLIAALW